MYKNQNKIENNITDIGLYLEENEIKKYVDIKDFNKQFISKMQKIIELENHQLFANNIYRDILVMITRENKTEGKGFGKLFSTEKTTELEWNWKNKKLKLKAIYNYNKK